MNTPRTDAMQRIQFEGCTCVVAAPEDIEQLETELQQAQAALAAMTNERDVFRKAQKICEDCDAPTVAEVAELRERLAAVTLEREEAKEELQELWSALVRFISKGTRDDGVDPEAYWIELSEEEYRSLQTLVHGDEQLSGSGGSMSAKTEDKQPPRELRCRHGILAGHCPDCPSEIDWSEVEHNERQQSTPKTQRAILPPVSKAEADRDQLQAQVGALKETLEWYADKSHWDDKTTASSGGDEECKIYLSTECMFFDNEPGWTRAVAALAQPAPAKSFAAAPDSAKDGQ